MYQYNNRKGTEMTREIQKVESVQFYNSTVECIKEGDTLWVSVRRVCESLGIASNKQVEKLRNKSWSRDTLMVSPDPRGRNQEQFFVDLDTVPLWLATIDENRVHGNIRPLLVKYQRECKQFLANHFLARFRMPTTLAEAGRLWVEAIEENEVITKRLEFATARQKSLEKKIRDDQPKIDFVEAVKKVGDNKEVAQLASVLSGEGIHLGRINLYRWLREQHIIMDGRRNGRYLNIPFQKYITNGWFVVERRIWDKANGSEDYEITLITPKGQAAIINKMKKNPETWAKYIKKQTDLALDLH